MPDHESGDVTRLKLHREQSGDVSTPLAALALGRREGRCEHTPSALHKLIITYTCTAPLPSLISPPDANN